MHLGNAIMSFYSALIDLLGRCAPEMHVSRAAFRTRRFPLSLHVTAAEQVVDKQGLVSYTMS